LAGQHRVEAGLAEVGRLTAKGDFVTQEPSERLERSQRRISTLEEVAKGTAGRNPAYADTFTERLLGAFLLWLFIVRLCAS